MFDNLCLEDTIRWSSVDDELPQYELPVLFWVDKDIDGNKRGCYVGWYSFKEYDGRRGRWFDIYGNGIYLGVTHWAPLPKGPDCSLGIGLEIRDYVYP